MTKKAKKFKKGEKPGFFSLLWAPVSLFSSLFLLILCPQSLEAREDAFRGPWSVSAQNPVIFGRFFPKNDQKMQKTTKISQKNPEISEKCGFSALNFYQNTLSVVVRSPCPMEPSCSNYARDAVKKHGLGPGLLLIMDRLLRENSEGYYAPLVKTEHRGYKYYDPVENSDFWWNRKTTNEDP